MQYHGASYAANVWDTFWFEKNLQGDIVAVYSGSGTKLVEYVYDAWGNHVTNYFNGGASTQASNNPFRYRGYYYDSDLELYCVGTRYYDSVIGRWINPDKYVSTGQGLTGYNLYAYCGNNPVNRIDPTGEAWWHWALGAAVVAACAIAVIATAGGAAAGIAAVTAVANGVAAATPASTVAAGAFIGASVAYGSAAFVAASTSKSVSEFNSQGDWETVATAAGGALLGGINGYDIARSQLSSNTSYNLNGSKDEAYLTKRGWDGAKINGAINNGKQGTSINMANGAPCTVYRYPGTNNQYVVIETDSRSVVQASNLNDPGWIPDSRIIWDP